MERENAIKLQDPADFFITPNEPNVTDYPEEHILDSLKPIFGIKSYQIEKEVDEKKLHWRNPAYLAKFLTNYSTIKRRKFTKLSIKSQNKVARTIKQARNMNILPNYTYLKTYHKKPLKTLQEDLD